MARNIVIKILIKLINLLSKRGNIAKPVNKKKYDTNPKTSICLQFFNKKQNIIPIWENLSIPGIDEIIILEDGSSDGSLDEWAGLATGKNHFVIRSNDLHEVRTYDRAIDFARGEIIALLQDDDLPPPDPTWLEDAVSLFNEFPKLAVLGGRNGTSLLPVTKVERDVPETYQRRGTKAGVPGVFEYEIIETPKINSSGIPFEFVQVVNRAPMFVRRSIIRDLGGIDQHFAPYQCDDVDICMRVWKSGFQVGLYRSGFARNIGIGGMRLYNANSGSHIQKNWKRIYQLHGAEISSGEIAEIVDRLNDKLRRNSPSSGHAR